MCRLFGFLSSHPCLPAEVLSEDLHRFYTLAGEHADGWGVSTWRGRRSDLDRATGGSGGRQISTCLDGVVADQGVLHLRRASVGEVEVANCHPFRWGDVHFAHNGEFSPSPALRKVRRGFEPVGTTDSELLFALVVGRYLELGEWGRAITEAVDQVRRKAHHYIALNLLLGTPEGIFVHQDVEDWEARQRVPGYFDLFTRTRSIAGVTVTEIASQGVEDQGWKKLPPRTVVHIGRPDPAPDMMARPEATHPHPQPHHLRTPS